MSRIYSKRKGTNMATKKVKKGNKKIEAALRKAKSQGFAGIIKTPRKRSKTVEVIPTLPANINSIADSPNVSSKAPDTTIVNKEIRPKLRRTGSRGFVKNGRLVIPSDAKVHNTAARCRARNSVEVLDEAEQILCQEAANLPEATPPAVHTEEAEQEEVDLGSDHFEEGVIEKFAYATVNDQLRDQEETTAYIVEALRKYEFYLTGTNLIPEFSPLGTEENTRKHVQMRLSNLLATQNDILATLQHLNNIQGY
jgi:hypothetical protein